SGEAPTIIDLRALANVRRDVAQVSKLMLRQHEIRPVRDRLDPLRQIVQPRARLNTASVPQQQRRVVIIASQVGASLRARGLDRLRTETEMRGEHGQLP